MQARQIHIRYLLQHHRTGDPSVGLVIIGDMQGGLRAERIICDYLQMMFPFRQSLDDGGKGSISIIMGCDFPVVQPDLRRMAHSFKFDSHISGTDNISFIAAPAPVCLRIRTAFPAAGYRSPVSDRISFPLFRQRAKIPKTGGNLLRFSDFMCSKCSYHIYRPFFSGFLYSFTAPIMTPFTKCFCIKG